MRDKPGPTLKPSLHDSASARPGDPGHDEWLLDESIEETFPASDPIAPATEPDEKPRGKVKGKREKQESRKAGDSESITEKR